MATYLQELGDYGPDKLTPKEKKELAELRKEYKKFREMDLVSKVKSGSDSDD